MASRGVLCVLCVKHPCEHPGAVGLCPLCVRWRGWRCWRRGAGWCGCPAAPMPPPGADAGRAVVGLSPVFISCVGSWGISRTLLIPRSLPAPLALACPWGHVKMLSSHLPRTTTGLRPACAPSGWLFSFNPPSPCWPPAKRVPLGMLRWCGEGLCLSKPLPNPWQYLEGGWRGAAGLWPALRCALVPRWGPQQWGQVVLTVLVGWLLVLQLSREGRIWSSLWSLRSLNLLGPVSPSSTGSLLHPVVCAGHWRLGRWC